MKRLLLGSLLSCMVFGQAFGGHAGYEEPQPSALTQINSFFRGAVHALTFPALFGAVGYCIGGDKWGVIGANVGSARGHFYWGCAALRQGSDANWDSFSGYLTTASLLHFSSIVYFATNHNLNVSVKL